MAVIRHGPAPEDHYSMVSNELARDPNISLQAKGIYLYLRSHREGWAMSTERIGDALGVHRNTIGKYVTELSNAGYLIKDQAKDEFGKFAGSDYVLMSSPVAQKSGNGQPCTNSRAAGFTGSGDIVQHKKTNSFKKTNSLKKNNNPHQKFGESFESFYEEYPRHVGKNEAWKRWQQQLEKVDEDSLVKAAKNFAIEHERQETPKQFIPHPSTFLNQERWRDYLDEPKESQPVSIGVFDDGSF